MPLNNVCAETAIILRLNSDFPDAGNLQYKSVGGVKDRQVDLQPVMEMYPADDPTFDWSRESGASIENLQRFLNKLDRAKSYYVRRGNKGEAGHFMVLHFDAGKGWMLDSSHTARHQLTNARGEIAAIRHIEGRDTAGNHCVRPAQGTEPGGREFVAADEALITQGLPWFSPDDIVPEAQKYKRDASGQVMLDKYRMPIQNKFATLKLYELTTERAFAMANYIAAYRMASIDEDMDSILENAARNAVANDPEAGMRISDAAKRYWEVPEGNEMRLRLTFEERRLKIDLKNKTLIALGDVDVLIASIRDGSYRDDEVVDKGGNTLLHLLAMQSFRGKESIQYILQNCHPTINKVNHAGKTPLDLLLETAEKNMLSDYDIKQYRGMFLEYEIKGKDASTQIRTNGMVTTYLHQACILGRPTIIADLMARGCINLFTPDSSGKKPLQLFLENTLDEQRYLESYNEALGVLIYYIVTSGIEPDSSDAIKQLLTHRDSEGTPFFDITTKFISPEAINALSLGEFTELSGSEATKRSYLEYSTLAIFPEPFALRSVRSTRLEGFDLEQKTKDYFLFRRAK